MTIHERAAQIWSVLALAARNRQLLTYEIVGQLIGVPPHGLARMLDPIQSFCMIRDLPPLTSLVVSRQTGLPSAGFVAATSNVALEQLRVFDFAWLDHSAPTPQLLEEASKQFVNKRVVPLTGSDSAAT